MEWSAIAIFYFACFAFGFIFALLGAIFGELGGHFHAELGGQDAGIGEHGVDLGGHTADIGAHSLEAGHEVGMHGPVMADGPDVDHAMPSANVFNTITIATFLSFFGLAGLVSIWIFHMPAILSLIFSLPMALLIAAGQFALWVKVFVKAQASSEATLSEILGSEAEVAATIPGDRVGQINYTIRGTRFTAPAVSSDGTDIPRGTRVVIVNIKGNTLVVRPIQ
ncbi:MAG: NfeD family protein [Armatimonadetes bacterium]|nr:NfeD family protein [Armatimonadota bacterium]